MNAVVRFETWDSIFLEAGSTSILRLGIPLEEYLPTFADPETKGNANMALNMEGEATSTVTELNHFDLFNMVAPVEATEVMYEGLTGKSCVVTVMFWLALLVMDAWERKADGLETEYGELFLSVKNTT